MSKAKSASTPDSAHPASPADDWRLAQLRRRAAGKGKHPLSAGRYSTIKRKLSGEVVARPALTLSRTQIDTLTEIATLVYYSDGFTYTAPMMALNKFIADRATPAAQHACLAEATAREHAYVAR